MTSIAEKPRALSQVFGAVLLCRLLYPFFDSPLQHLFSDPARHWANGAQFLHPSFMGAGDPLLYQLWIFLLRSLTGDSPPWIQLGSGVLCAAMPYGWYRALRELLPRRQALGGALVVALTPAFLGLYAYFMTETLLLTLTGFAFWMTLRAWRKGTLGSWTLCALAWTLAVFTRQVMLPVAAACLGAVWLAHGQRLARTLIAAAAFALLAVPAGLHSRSQLGYFAPLGNSYITQLYNLSGLHDIALDTGSGGQWFFGSPSYYNPTFYPFSDWTTSRQGTVEVSIDPAHGRADWIAERTRVEAQSPMSTGRRLYENLLYLLFGQSWPDNDRGTIVGVAAIWNRWLVLPLLLYVAWGALRRKFTGPGWLLPVCALGMFVLLELQNTAIIEGRYRKPIEPILLAAAVLLFCNHRYTATPRHAHAAAPTHDARA